MAKTNPKYKARIRRKRHIRKSIVGTQECPRLSVFRSTKHIYAQLIDDSQGVTLASASTITAVGKGELKYGGNKSAAEFIGNVIAANAKEKGISSVVFDRNGYLYHGRVKALADAARKGGLQF